MLSLDLKRCVDAARRRNLSTAHFVYVGAGSVFGLILLKIDTQLVVKLRALLLARH